MANNEQLVLIENSARWTKEKMDDNTYSLNYKQYKADLDLNEKEAKQFDAISDYKTDLTFNSLPYEQKLFEQDTTLRDKRNRWHENLSKDVYVAEALNVLNDLEMTYEIKKVTTIKN